MKYLYLLSMLCICGCGYVRDGDTVKSIRPLSKTNERVVYELNESSGDVIARKGLFNIGDTIKLSK